MKKWEINAEFQTFAKCICNILFKYSSFEIITHIEVFSPICDFTKKKKKNAKKLYVNVLMAFLLAVGDLDIQ